PASFLLVRPDIPRRPRNPVTRAGQIDMKKDMNPDELVAGYRAFGMRKRDAILQARLYRRASAPQAQRVTFCVDAETLADLRAGRERAMKRAAKFNPMAEVETRCSTNS